MQEQSHFRTVPSEPRLPASLQNTNESSMLREQNEQLENLKNCYGDCLEVTGPGFGQEISAQRLDYLDIACIEFAIKCIQNAQTPLKTVELGCGKGIQSLRLALLGFEAHSYDIQSADNVFTSANQAYPLCRIRHHQIDLLSSFNVPDEICLCFSQRFLHYAPFERALGILSTVNKTLTSGGRAFISVAGVRSEIGQAHPKRTAALHERFDFLAPHVAQKHNIHAKLVVYHERELGILGEAAGFRIADLSMSEFGNVKGVFEKI
jgi:hypothetical protein